MKRVKTIFKQDIRNHGSVSRGIPLRGVNSRVSDCIASRKMGNWPASHAMMGIGNYWCQKSQLTVIPCDHLLTVCSFRMMNYTQYVSPYYTIQYYINTWSGHWCSYGNKQDWSMYNGPVIRSDPAKSIKGMRRKIHISMVMDEM
jgi:hypothetical protein